MTLLDRILKRLRRTAGQLRSEDGFTLVELIVSVAIMGILAVAIGGSVFVGARASVASSNRLRESTDAQLLTTWFQRDAASASTVNTVPTSRPSGGTCAAGITAGAKTVVLLGWTQPNGAGTVAHTAYYYQPAGQDTIVRRGCENNVNMSQITLMQNAGSWSLDTSACIAPCTRPASMKLHILNTDTGYEYAVGSMLRTTDSKSGPDMAPSIKTISLVDPSETNRSEVRWLIEFSEEVRQVSKDDFKSRDTDGAGGATVKSVDGAPSVARRFWTVTVDTTVGPSSGPGMTLGKLFLDLAASQNIVDKSNKPLDGSAWTDKPYQIDKIAPTYTLVKPASQVTPTASLPIHFTATFSEPVTGLEVIDITKAGNSGGGVVAVTNPSGDRRTYDITVVGITDGTVTVNIAGGSVTDVAGNTNTASVTSAAVRYDSAPPTVVSITRLGPPITNSTSVSWAVTFSEAVTGVNVTSPSDFRANENLNTTPTLTLTRAATCPASPGACALYTVTANIGTVTSGSAIALELLNNGSIVDQSSQALTAGLIGDGYTIDQIKPTVTVNQKPSGQADPTTKLPIVFTAVFSEPINGLIVGDVTLGGTAAGKTVSSIATINATTYEIIVDGLTSDGTVIASIPLNAVTDAANNGNSASTSTDNTVTYNGTPGTVTGVSSPTANGTYRAGTVIPVTVTFTKPVVVTGTPQLTLATGAPATTTVNYTGGSGTAVLTFTYTVGAGNVSPDLDYTSATALALAGGTIKDTVLGQNAILTLAPPAAAGSLGGNKNIAVDGVVPSVPSVPNLDSGSDSGSSNSDDLTNDTTPTFTGTAEPGATVTIYDGATAVGTGVASAGGNYTVTTSTLSTGARVITATARDAGGNVSAPSGPRTVTIDTSTPTPSISTASPANNTVDVTFSSTEGGVTWECRVESGSWSSCTSVKRWGPNNSYNGSRSYQVRATDAAGNTATASQNRSA